MAGCTQLVATELTEGAASRDGCAARDADAYDKNHQEHGYGSGCGARQEVEKNVIQAHGRSMDRN